MNKIIQLKYFIILIGLISISSCKDKFTKSFNANVPIYMSLEDWRAEEFTIQTPRGISSTGKIWLKDQYLFISEPMKGIHIYDNSNPSSPINIGFIAVEANIDIAIKDNTLFFDNYIDLVSLDISNPAAPSFLCRNYDVFNRSKLQSFEGYNSSLPAVNIDSDNGIIIGWKQEEVTEDFYNDGIYYDDSTIDFAVISNVSSVSSNSPSVSMGGSMANFTITNNHLYILERWSMISFNINDNCLTETNRQNISREGETLFSANGHLFIGTTTGMLIYNLNDPNSPTYLSEYPHVGSCDPVIVTENRAYVTLRTGNRCQGDINQLVVVDISNLGNPFEIESYDMTNPHGLGIDNNTLFLCDGDAGLKIFDASNDYTISQNMISHFQNINTYDVIPFNNTLIMVGREGIYQYDYSDLENIVELSLISIN